MEGEINNFFNLVRRKLLTIVSVVIVFLFLAIIITFIQPLKYSSESRLLVVQNFPEDTDPYAISKSNEYLSTILSKIVASNLFYDDIKNSGFPIDKTYFLMNGNTKKEMEKWRATVQSRAISDTGIIEINVYHPDKQQLSQIADAVNFVLKSKHKLYHGAGDSVAIKIIDKPILSNWPTKPNIILNIFISVFFALILSISYIYLFPEEKNDIRLWPKKKKKEIDESEYDYDNEVEEGNNNWQSIGDIIAERAERIAETRDFKINDTSPIDSVQTEDIEETLPIETEQAEDVKDVEEENRQNIIVPKLSNIDIPNNEDEEEVPENKKINLENDRKDYFKDSFDSKLNKEDDEIVAYSFKGEDEAEDKDLENNNNHDIFEGSEIKVEKDLSTKNSYNNFRDDEDDEEEVEEINKMGNMNNLF